jgi:hypothetical protein
MAATFTSMFLFLESGGDRNEGGQFKGMDGFLKQFNISLHSLFQNLTHPQLVHSKRFGEFTV